MPIRMYRPIATNEAQENNRNKRTRILRRTKCSYSLHHPRMPPSIRKWTWHGAPSPLSLRQSRDWIYSKRAGKIARRTHTHCGFGIPPTDIQLFQGGIHFYRLTMQWRCLLRNSQLDQNNWHQVYGLSEQHTVTLLAYTMNGGTYHFANKIWTSRHQKSNRLPRYNSKCSQIAYNKSMKRQISNISARNAWEITYPPT